MDMVGKLESPVYTMSSSSDKLSSVKFPDRYELKEEYRNQHNGCVHFIIRGLILLAESIRTGKCRFIYLALARGPPNDLRQFSIDYNNYHLCSAFYLKCVVQHAI